MNDQTQHAAQPVNQQTLAALKGITEEINGLMSESEGVAGFHRNGDIAPWHELEAGGRYERLSSLPDAMTAIAAAEAQPSQPAELELALFAENQKRLDVEQERDQFQQQRDQLLAALKSAKHMLERDHIDPAKMAVIEQCDAAIAAVKAEAAPAVCNWHQEDEDGSWHSSCGAHFWLNEGTPSENDMKFCHKCGKPMAEHPWTEEDAEGGKAAIPVQDGEAQ